MTAKLRQPATVIAMLALFASLSGGAIAAKLITGKGIKDGSLQAKDLSGAARTSLQGQVGASGAAGPKGDTGAPGATGAAGAGGSGGPAGAQGPAGTNGSNGAAGPTGSAGQNGAAGPTGQNGTAGTIGPTGQNGTVGPTGAAGPTGPTGLTGPAIGDALAEYGVGKVFANTTELKTIYTSDVPDDGNNAAETGTVVPYVIQPGARTISLRGVMRSKEADGGEQTASMIIRTAGGQVVAAGASPFSQAVGNEPLTSSAPSSTSGTEVVSVTIPNSVPDGTLVTIDVDLQAFDGNDG